MSFALKKGQSALYKKKHGAVLMDNRKLLYVHTVL